MRYPEIAVPDDVRDVIAQMGEVALSLVEKVGRRDRRPRHRAGPGDRGRGRLDGRAAPQAVHPAAVAELVARHRGRDRHDPARPLLRALRRPRRRRWPGGSSSSSPASARAAASATSSTDRADRRSATGLLLALVGDGLDRGSAAASGSRYAAGRDRQQGRRRRGRSAAGCRSGRSATTTASSDSPSRCLTSARSELPCAATSTVWPRRRSGTIASYQYGSIRSTTSRGTRCAAPSRAGRRSAGRRPGCTRRRRPAAAAARRRSGATA